VPREHVLLSYGLTPRLLSRDLAAEYCGVSPPTFDEHVAKQIPPIELGRRNLWDIRALDRWLDVRSGLIEAPLPAVTDLIGTLGVKSAKAGTRR
jgi:hypothetical protein